MVIIMVPLQQKHKLDEESTFEINVTYLPEQHKLNWFLGKT